MQKRKIDFVVPRSGRLCFFLAFTLSACNPSGRPEVSITWDVIDGARQELVLENRGSVSLPASGWTIYFNFGRTISAVNSPAVAVERINGDFYRLRPAPEFTPLEPGAGLRIPFRVSWPAIKASDAPSGFYFVFGGGQDSGAEVVDIPPVRIGPFDEPGQTRRSPLDRWPVPDAGSRFRQNPEPLARQRTVPVLPAPLLLRRSGQSLRVTRAFEIGHAGLEGEAAYLAAALQPLLGAPLAVKPGEGRSGGAILLRVSDLTVAGRARRSGDEAYRLRVEPGRGIEIAGSDPAGVFYGIQTLRALISPAEGGAAEVEAVTVEDAPRFAYRGLHLDVSRNFQSGETVKKLLDLMAFYKLNRFHFHLSDDEGWRLAIPGLPELVEVGGRRGHTLDERDHLVPSYGSGPDADAFPGSGHYTRRDFIEMLRHAAARHIEVIPEIDVPGHARAAIVAMEARRRRLEAEGLEEEAAEYLLSEAADRSRYRSVQNWTGNVINVCRESSYRFLGRVLDELQAMYAEAGAPLSTVHTGGDEVPRGAWEQSPACRRLIDADPELDGVEDLPAYFLRRFADMIAERGLVTAGWEEIGLREEEVEGGVRKEPNPGFADRRFQLYVWNSIWGGGYEDNAYKLANAGYPVVLANASNLYFDMAYDKDPEEPGYYWANLIDTRTAWEFSPGNLYAAARVNTMGHPIDFSAYRDRARLGPAGRRNILGIQGQLWGETLKSAGRLEYMLFPRLLALAERAWAARPDWEALAPGPRRERLLERDWKEFASRVGSRELPRLDVLAGGVSYRIPPPGAVIEEGRVKANVEFPGLAIRYTTDGTQPTAASTLYTEPVPATGTVRLRVFDSRGRGGRTVTIGQK